MIRDGRIGKVKKVTCAIGDAPDRRPVRAPCPFRPSSTGTCGSARPRWSTTRKKRCHYEFRWWYEYSGGKMTDWGAHHVDIATWAIGADTTGPISVEGTAMHPNIPNGYNTATEFHRDLQVCRRHGARSFATTPRTASRSKARRARSLSAAARSSGKPVDELKDNPLPEGAIEKLYGGKPTSHMANFFECVKSRKQPISDVFTHHRSITTCHLANIAIRLGRKINWDPAGRADRRRLRSPVVAIAARSAKATRSWRLRKRRPVPARAAWRGPVGRQPLIPADDEGDVLAAEAEAVGQGVVAAGLPGCVGDVVQVALGIGRADS